MKLDELMPDIYQMISYDYQSIKSVDFETVLSSVQKDTKSKDMPTLVQVSGMPAAGKSTYCQQFLKENPDYIYVGFDKIMESLDGYRQDVRRFGSVQAFLNWEMPARVIGYELLKRLIGTKNNILLEHSGTNDAHIQLMKNVKKKGYKTKVYFVMCDEQKAMHRAVQREKETGRHTPPEIIHERAGALKKYMELYKVVVDDFKIFELSDK